MKLYGRNPVLERLRSNPKSIKRIFIEEGHKDTAYFRQKANKWGIPMAVIPASKMLKIARNWNTQGILIDVDDFGYIPYDDLLEEARAKRRTIIFLDGITDPQNLGAIIRNLACLGSFAVVLPTHDAAGVTETVLRIASGAENHVPIAQVSNLNPAIVKAKEKDYWIAGTVVDGGQSIYDVQWPSPVGLVIGSEQKGIKEIIKKNLDLLVSIPMAHPRLSLNVASAVAVCAFEVTRQVAAYKKKREQA